MMSVLGASCYLMSLCCVLGGEERTVKNSKTRGRTGSVEKVAEVRVKRVENRGRQGSRTYH